MKWKQKSHSQISADLCFLLYHENYDFLNHFNPTLTLYVLFEIKRKNSRQSNFCLFDDHAGICVLLAQYINNLDSLFVPKQLHSLTNPFTL